MSLREEVIAALAEAADPARAPQQQAYMKSAMPYFGSACRTAGGSPAPRPGAPLPDAGAWEAAVLDLWRKAARREERYAAVELLVYPRYAKMGWSRRGSPRSRR